MRVSSHTRGVRVEHSRAKPPPRKHASAPRPLKRGFVSAPRTGGWCGRRRRRSTAPWPLCTASTAPAEQSLPCPGNNNPPKNARPLAQGNTPKGAGGGGGRTMRRVSMATHKAAQISSTMKTPFQPPGSVLQSALFTNRNCVRHFHLAVCFFVSRFGGG